MDTNLLASMLAAGLITPVGATGTLPSLLADGLNSELSYMSAEQAEHAIAIETDLLAVIAAK